MKQAITTYSALLVLHFTQDLQQNGQPNHACYWYNGRPFFFFFFFLILKEAIIDIVLMLTKAAVKRRGGNKNQPKVSHLHRTHQKRTAHGPLDTDRSVVDPSNHVIPCQKLLKTLVIGLCYSVYFCSLRIKITTDIEAIL